MSNKKWLSQANGTENMRAPYCRTGFHCSPSRPAPPSQLLPPRAELAFLPRPSPSAQRGVLGLACPLAAPCLREASMLSGVGLRCPMGRHAATQAVPGDARRAHQASSLEQPVPVPDATSHPQLPRVKQGLSILFCPGLAKPLASVVKNPGSSQKPPHSPARGGCPSLWKKLKCSLHPI